MDEQDSNQRRGEHQRRAERAGRRFRSGPRFPDEPEFGPRGGHGGHGGFGGHGGHEFGDEPEFGGGPGGPEFGGQEFAGGPPFGGPGFPGRPGFRGGHGPHGRGGFAGGPPGFGAWPRGSGRRGSRAKRGDVRAAALALLAEEPMNGYQIIQQIGERSGGIWRPSPGSVYPALAQLEDENLIAAAPTDGGRRAYSLTDDGRAYVAAHAAELREPWSAMTTDAASAAVDMRTLVGQVHLAAFQVVSAGTEAQVSQARKVLAQARRALYRILADDEEAGGGPDSRPASQEAGPGTTDGSGSGTSGSPASASD